jgi:hypothetical protein
MIMMEKSLNSPEQSAFLGAGFDARTGREGGRAERSNGQTDFTGQIASFGFHSPSDHSDHSDQSGP